VKKSQHLHLNNSFYIVKAENDWRYFGLVATRNKIIKLLHEAQKKGDPVGISLDLYTIICMCLCILYLSCCFEQSVMFSVIDCSI